MNRKKILKISLMSMIFVICLLINLFINKAYAFEPLKLDYNPESGHTYSSYEEINFNGLDTVIHDYQYSGGGSIPYQNVQYTILSLADNPGTYYIIFDSRLNLYYIKPINLPGYMQLIENFNLSYVVKTTNYFNTWTKLDYNDPSKSSANNSQLVIKNDTDNYPKNKIVFSNFDIKNKTGYYVYLDNGIDKQTFIISNGTVFNVGTPEYNYVYTFDSTVTKSVKLTFKLKKTNTKTFVKFRNDNIYVPYFWVHGDGNQLYEHMSDWDSSNKIFTGNFTSLNTKNSTYTLFFTMGGMGNQKSGSVYLSNVDLSSNVIVKTNLTEADIPDITMPSVPPTDNSGEVVKFDIFNPLTWIPFLVDKISEGFTNLFVPKSDFLSSKFNELKAVFDTKFAFVNDIKEIFSHIVGYSNTSDTPPAFYVDLPMFGLNHACIVDFSNFTQYRPILINFIKFSSWILFFIWVIKKAPQILGGGKG